MKFLKNARLLNSDKAAGSCTSRFPRVFLELSPPVRAADEHRSFRGFSLLEIMAVILLISIFAAAVRGPVVSMLDAMTSRNAVDQIKTIDRQLRQQATRSGQAGLLHIDLLEGTLTRTDNRAEQVSLGQPIQLAENIRIEQIRIAPPRDNFDQLNAVFECSPDGVTPTYALEVQTPSRTTWLLFAGLTGECYELNSEDDLAQVLDELSRPWSELN